MAEQVNNWQQMIQSRLSRRSFLRGFGAAGAGVAVSAMLPAKIAAATGIAPLAALGLARPNTALPFTPTAPTEADTITLPDGFTYQVVIKRGDVFTPNGDTFGDNCDWTGWYPIDALEGGDNAEEGLLVVNHEYFNSIFVSGYVDGEKTVEQINLEKATVGLSVVHLRRIDGVWTVVADSTLARKFDANTPVQFVGAVAGAAVVNGASEVVGTLANCSGGQTPWLTALSCEENYQSYYGEDSVNEVDMASTYLWLNDAANAHPPEHYGWVVEVDPFGGSIKKLTGLGRFRHENVAIAIGKSGKVVAYMGDDARDECVYKFVSENSYDASNREANLNILETGTLYVANFSNGRWIPVVWEGNEERLGNPGNVGGYVMTSQADVLTYCSQAARALGGTRTDRPEDIEIHPATGEVYIAFTNNSNHGNFHGQIARIQETDGDHESLTFAWDIFAVGGPQSGFSSPDNMIFDKAGNLWVVTDISSGSLNGGIYQFHSNNAVFVIPTSGEDFGKVYRFGSGPVEAECTGPTFVGSNTLFLAVQHPGEESEAVDNASSHWPDGGDSEPRAAVVAIVGPFGN